MVRDKQREKEDKIFAAYQSKFNQNDLPGALDELEKLLKVTNIKAFVSSLKVDVLMQMGKMQEALDAAELGLQYPNPSSQLYKQHAELLFSMPGEQDGLAKALTSIDTAINLYNTDNINEDINERFQDADTFKFWFENKTRTRAEMISLRSDIKSLINSVQVYESVQKIETSISQEKIKVIELMALFTAVIALIFTNAQSLVQKREVIDIIIANSSTLVALTWLLYLVNRITKHGTILPRPSGEQFGKAFVLLMMAALVCLVFSAVVYVMAITYKWLSNFL